MLLAYSQRISGQEFFSLMNLFLVQHGLKVIRLAKLITEWKNSYNLNKWANLTFNFGYLHAANVSLLASQLSKMFYFSLLFFWVIYSSWDLLDGSLGVWIIMVFFRRTKKG